MKKGATGPEYGACGFFFCVEVFVCMHRKVIVNFAGKDWTEGEKGNEIDMEN